MRRDQAGALFTANRHDMSRVKADLSVVWEDLRETE